ncbi:hypothetical protein ACMZ6Z_09325, partial [Streptococcus pluranimalium]|uniref:hypothetical protein n=1 Tax=Streptococcus pluranimalium TaxID=82348 RepID=UPI0039FCDEA8
ASSLSVSAESPQAADQGATAQPDQDPQPVAVEVKALHLAPIAKTGLVWSTSLTPEDFLTNSADLKAQGASISFAQRQPMPDATSVSLTVTYPDGTKTLIQVPLTQMVQPAEAASSPAPAAEAAASVPESPAALESAPADSQAQPDSEAQAEADQGKKRVKRAEPLSTPVKGEVIGTDSIEVEGEKLLLVDPVKPEDYNSDANTLTLRGQGKPGERLRIDVKVEVPFSLKAPQFYIRDMGFNQKMSFEVEISPQGKWEKTVDLTSNNIRLSPDLTHVTYNNEKLKEYVNANVDRISSYNIAISFDAYYLSNTYSLGNNQRDKESLYYHKSRNRLNGFDNPLEADVNPSHRLVKKGVIVRKFKKNQTEFYIVLKRQTDPVDVSSRYVDSNSAKKYELTSEYVGLFYRELFSGHDSRILSEASREQSLGYLDWGLLEPYYKYEGSQIRQIPDFLLVKITVPDIVAKKRELHEAPFSLRTLTDNELNSYVSIFTYRIVPALGDPIDVPDLEAISPEDRQRALVHFKAINQDTPHFLKGVAGGIDSQVTIDEKGNITVTYDDYSTDVIPYTQLFKKVEQLALVNQPKLQAITPTTVEDMTALEAPEKAAIKAEILLKNPDLVALLKDGEDGINVSPTGDVTLTYT